MEWQERGFRQSGNQSHSRELHSRNDTESRRCGPQDDQVSRTRGQDTISGRGRGMRPPRGHALDDFQDHRSTTGGRVISERSSEGLPTDVMKSGNIRDNSQTAFDRRYEASASGHVRPSRGRARGAFGGRGFTNRRSGILETRSADPPTQAAERSDYYRGTRHTMSDGRHEVLTSSESHFHSQQIIPAGRAEIQDAAISSLSTGAISHPTSTCGRDGQLEQKRLDTVGTKGKPVVVKANFFPFENFSMEKAFHFDVTFIPEKPKSMLCLVLKEFTSKYFPDKIIAFDGRKNAYTMSPFTDKVINGEVRVYNEEKKREMEFHVILKHVASVDLSNIDQRCIQVLETVLRSAAAMKYVSVGRSFFSFEEMSQPIVEGLEVRIGTHLSIKRGNKLYLNINTVHKPFLKSQPALDTLKDICVSRFQNPSEVNLNRPLQREQFYRLKDMLRGSKVSYSCRGAELNDRVYTVNDVSFAAYQQRFEFNGKDITVENYFKYEKRSPLKYANLPCFNVGTSKRPQYLPIELCKIVGGQVLAQRKLSNVQTSAIIQNSITDAPTKEKLITKSLQYLDLNKSPQIKEFEIDIKPVFQKINARVLEPPFLQYRTVSLQPQNGEWRSESSFLMGASLKEWTVIILDNCISREDVINFTDSLQKEGKDMGLNMGTPIPFKSTDLKNLEPCLKSCERLELVFVIHCKNKSIYSRVKKMAELEIGLLTQCITNTIARRKKDYKQIVHNVIQKVNAKLGGVNHTIQETVLPSKISTAAIMYVGADVTHPTGDKAGTPSVAAVCASHDKTGFQFNTQIRIQKALEEIITDLEDMMIKHLKYYEQNMGKKPEVILFFRDGVGEGQFEAVRKHELFAIQRACSKLSLQYKPAITFLVVQKRHHARFFPNEQSQGRYKNVSPGTIIDNTITNPEEQEFYLVSHSSPRGCCRPCRYNCLFDDNNLSADELHEIVYYCCFTYSRCERSVSYPVPTYNAHHAASRGKLYLLGENSSNFTNKYLEKLTYTNQKLKSMHYI